MKSLEDLTSVCGTLNCQFRVFGSLIPAALKGEFYREVGDVDCFVDSKFKKEVAGELEKKEYVKSNKRDEDIPLHLYWLGVRTENFRKNNQKISVLFVSFKEKHLEMSLILGLSFRIPYDLVDKDYEFYGKEFKGLTPEAALFTLSFVKDETKREIDRENLLPFCDSNTIKTIKNTDTFFWLGKRVPLISGILAAQINKLSPTA